MHPSRRDVLKAAGASFAVAAAGATRLLHAQQLEESKSPSVTLVRKGIDKYIDVINVDLLEAQAKAALPEATYVFIANGSGEQWTLHENRRAFGDFVFTPHRLNGISRDRIDTSITLLGLKLPHPVLIAPFGSHGLVHPEAELATARGAAKSGALFCAACTSTASLEDISRYSTGPKFFQIYLNVDLGISKEQLQRARDAGYKAIVLTVDAVGQSSSDEYVRLNKARPWLPYGNFPTGNANAFKTDVSFNDIEMVRRISGLPVVVKGLMRPEDAVAAVKAGASAIQVSNHGGRQLDGTPAAITVLPRIVDALQGSVPVIFDSGIRRGTDVAKALALGATAVAAGRPVWWALTVGGAGGVAGVMDYFQRELKESMLELGVDRIESLKHEYVEPHSMCGEKSS